MLAKRADCAYAEGIANNKGGGMKLGTYSHSINKSLAARAKPSKCT